MAPIFSILAVGALIAPIGNAMGWLFITQDRTREMRNQGIATTAIAITSFIVGLPWGPRGVAFCYVAAGAAWAPVTWWIATRRGPVSPRTLVRALTPYVTGAFVTVLALASATHVFPKGLSGLTASLVLAYGVFPAVLLAFSHSRRTLASFVGQLGLHRVLHRALSPS